MTPIKETRLYKWSKAVVDSMSDNPIDTSIAVALVSIFVTWALTEAWRGSGPLTTFANSWGDFGGSIIGGIVAFSMAWLTLKRQDQSNRRREAILAAPKAEEAARQLRKWSEDNHHSAKRIDQALRRFETTQLRSDIIPANYFSLILSTHEFQEPMEFEAETAAAVKSIWPDFDDLFKGLCSRASIVRNSSDWFEENLKYYLGLKNSVDRDTVAKMVFEIDFDGLDESYESEIYEEVAKLGQVYRGMDKISRVVLDGLTDLSAGRLPGQVEDKEALLSH